MNQNIRLTINCNLPLIFVSILLQVLNKSVLYVELPRVLAPEASKHSFMSLLEFAEEKLNCSQLILCMSKAREDRQNLIRTFMFLGFQPLSPKSPFVRDEANTFDAAQNLFLMYTIVEDSSSDEEEEDDDDDEGLDESESDDDE